MESAMHRFAARTTLAIALLSLLSACVEPQTGSPADEEEALFGSGDHSMDGLALVVVAGEQDGLDEPRDLAFDPERPDELWVVNQGDSSAVILYGAGTAGQEAVHHAASGNQHFLARPSGIAFSDNRYLATIHETDEPTQGPPEQGGTPADFMGPTLWYADLGIFDGGHAGHMDMLHNSPDGMGIASEGGNAFWVFDGAHRSLTRYDFGMDHGPGGADHSDGVIHRYVEGEVKRRAGVPSHMEYDRQTDLLYVADTGNGRIAVLDALTGEVAGAMGPNYDGAEQRRVEGAELWTLVEGDDVNLNRPSGLALLDGILYVTDNATGVLFAFDLDGELVDWVDLELESGALMGIEFDAGGRLHLIDGLRGEVLRLVRD
jgi:hypothetical protein